MLASLLPMLLPPGPATAAGAPSIAQLLNVSTRGITIQPTESAVERKLIGGFVTTGTGDVLIRVAGPAYLGFLHYFAADPALQVFRDDGTHSTLLAENDDWPSDGGIAETTEQVGAFPYPSGSKDAAVILRQIPPGSYTVHATYTPTPTAPYWQIVSFEAYEIGESANPGGLFANISTRGRTAAGEKIMIPGFVIQGDLESRTRVLVRAVGPTLGTDFGVSDALANPSLILARGSEYIANNEDWSSDPANRQACIDAASAVGAFQLLEGSLDAALVIDLPPGEYTALCQGAPSAPEGNVLVEVYRVPGPQ